MINSIYYKNIYIHHNNINNLWNIKIKWADKFFECLEWYPIDWISGLDSVYMNVVHNNRVSTNIVFDSNSIFQHTHIWFIRRTKNNRKIFIYFNRFTIEMFHQLSPYKANVWMSLSVAVQLNGLSILSWIYIYVEMITYMCMPIWVCDCVF